MRGCLSIIVLAIVFVVAGTWLVGPGLAGFVVESGLSTTGFHGTNTSVTVTSDPRLELLTGHADEVRIESNQATLDRFTAARVDLTLGDVQLISRDFTRVDGTLVDATMTTAAGATLQATEVDFSGQASAADVTIRVDRQALTAMALASLAHERGVAVGSVKVSAPDRILFSVGASTIAGRLVIHDGGLSVAVALPGDPQLELIESQGDLRLTDATIRDEDLILRGILDTTELIH
jgi:hypothetical protein